MKTGKQKIGKFIQILLLSGLLAGNLWAQTETPPPPSAPKSVKVPAVKEKSLKNGLDVVVIENKNVPLVTAQLVIKAGAEAESPEEAGLADMTASLITKGTKTRSATDVAEQIEFLGGAIFSGANWNSSFLTVNVMSDKLDKAMEIMADSALNPAFKQEEIDLLKSQTLDGLTYNLSQPGFLANYVASVYTFDKHPAGGTVESVNNVKREDFVEFHKRWYAPWNAVLIITGDITAARANELAQKYFGKWEVGEITQNIMEGPQQPESPEPDKTPVINRILVVDLPNSGQASVKYALNIKDEGRVSWNEKSKENEVSDAYYSATVLNSLLGGGYSSRLNQEIRIKRGLSYGAGSGFAWTPRSVDFSTFTQTKNESAAEVADLVVTEINRLRESDIPEAELNPRRLVLTGSFGRSLETTRGLAAAVSDLYSFDLSADVLNSYMSKVQSVTDKQIKNFALEYLKGGDLIIVGDYSVFKDDLAKRFPGMKVEVIKADQLDISQEDLRKAD
ncbi:MAG: pitrilysin family protein [Pyrinomonadaceae bacterium]